MNPLSKIADKFNHRIAATTLFYTGNATLLTGSFDKLDTPKIIASGILLTVTALYPLTSRRPQLFAPLGTGIIGAQSIIATYAEGAGQSTQIAGTIPPSIQGALMIRKAYNEVKGYTFKAKASWQKPLEWIDKRPIMSGALIEGPGVATIALGAYMSKEWPLFWAASQWTAANIFLGLSDKQPTQLAEKPNTPDL